MFISAHSYFCAPRYLGWHPVLVFVAPLPPPNTLLADTLTVQHSPCLIQILETQDRLILFTLCQVNSYKSLIKLLVLASLGKPLWSPWVARTSGRQSHVAQTAARGQLHAEGDWRAEMGTGLTLHKCLWMQKRYQSLTSSVFPLQNNAYVLFKTIRHMKQSFCNLNKSESWRPFIPVKILHPPLHLSCLVATV